eukprot:gene20880-27723_t
MAALRILSGVATIALAQFKNTLDDDKAFPTPTPTVPHLPLSVTIGPFIGAFGAVRQVPLNKLTEMAALRM